MTLEPPVQETLAPRPIEKPFAARILPWYEKYMLVIGVLGQLLFYMQALKIFLSQSAGDVSLIGFLCGTISVSSWLFYGVLLKNRALMVANGVAVAGSLLVLLGVCLYG